VPTAGQVPVRLWRAASEERSLGGVGGSGHEHDRHSSHDLGRIRTFGGGREHPAGRTGLHRHDGRCAGCCWVLSHHGDRQERPPCQHDARQRLARVPRALRRGRALRSDRCRPLRRRLPRSTSEAQLGSTRAACRAGGARGERAGRCSPRRQGSRRRPCRREAIPR